MSPPKVKTDRKPSANNIGVSRLMFPRQSVAIQLRTLIPVGTAITIDASMNQTFERVGIPTANMWCAQTRSERKPIATVEKAIAL